MKTVVGSLRFHVKNEQKGFQMVKLNYSAQFTAPFNQKPTANAAATRCARQRQTHPVFVETSECALGEARRFLLAEQPVC